MAGHRDSVHWFGLLRMYVLGQWGPRIRVKGTEGGIVEKVIDIGGAISTVSSVSTG